MTDPTPASSGNVPVDDERKAEEAQQAAWTRNLPYIVGGVALTVYIVLVFYLINKINGDRVDDAVWMRMLYLFTGVESIAFAAAGFVFGREVNRGRAEAAEHQASRESRRAANEQAGRARLEMAGKALTMKIRHLAEDQPHASDRRGLESALAVAPLKVLAREAEQLFP
jgi:hypothetical protein